MKNLKYILPIVMLYIFMAGCSDEFLDRPPQDALVDATFYKNDAQILAGTAPLYSAVWKSYVDKANFKLGDMRGGTVFRAWNDQDALQFSITDVSEPNEQAYQAFFVTIGQANLIINNINTYAGEEVTDEIKNHAIAEARFMRAVAYRHLVMNYGPVPLIENNLDHLTGEGLRRNVVEDVWEFVRRDFEFAKDNLLEEQIEPGRLTRWSAEGMLARTHLTLAGVYGAGGSRDQAHLDKAKEYAESVITQSGRSLLDNYENLFRYPYDNNDESLFELQWVFATTNGYEASNTMVSQITYSNAVAANGDGWGGDLGASWWILEQYDGLIVDGGETPGFTLDDRLKATFMLPGFTYDELQVEVDGETGPLVFENPGDDADLSFASIKKYVVGKLDGDSDRQRYPNNTYMLRLAEMYLIYAEAVLGNNASTTDGKALEYFNAVHMRAGLPEFTDPLTYDEIFSERAKEFAMESMIWYDLVRLHYYNPQKAYDIINNQDRGLFVVHPNQWPDPNAWTFAKTEWFAFRNADANSGNFLLPIPASEINQAASLSLEPVGYDFSE